MILSGKEIESRIGDDIIIDPYDKGKLNPNSYNLSLNDELLVYKDMPLDMKEKNKIEKLTIPKDGLVLEPSRLYLGRNLRGQTSNRGIFGVKPRIVNKAFQFTIRGLTIYLQTNQLTKEEIIDVIRNTKES